MHFDAIVLAGGAGSRMGGVSKADLPLRGRRLLDVVLAAVADADRVVVVGRVAVPDGVLRTCEDPPGQGPAAGAGAGLDALDEAAGSAAPWTLLLAVDLPGADAIVKRLTTAAATAPLEVDGLCLRDPNGRTQWLAGAHRSGRLREVFRNRQPLSGIGVKSVLSDLRLGQITTEETVVADIDTWADHDRWQHPPPIHPHGGI